jgi:hypothetical protein
MKEEMSFVAWLAKDDAVAKARMSTSEAWEVYQREVKKVIQKELQEYTR